MNCGIEHLLHCLTYFLMKYIIFLLIIQMLKESLFNYNAICHSQIYSCPNYLNNEFKDQSRFELWYFFWKSYKPYFMAKQNIRICFYQQNIKDVKATYIFPCLSTHNYRSQVKEIYSCWRNNETFNSLRLFHIK